MKNAITREDLERIRELLPEQEGYYSNVVINHVDYQRILCFFARMEDSITRAEKAEAQVKQLTECAELRETGEACEPWDGMCRHCANAAELEVE